MSPFAPLMIWGAVKEDEGGGPDPLTARWDDVSLAIVCGRSDEARAIAGRLVEARPTDVGTFAAWRGELGGRLRVAVLLAPEGNPFAIHAAAAQAALLCPNALAVAHFEGAIACGVQREGAVGGGPEAGECFVGGEVAFLNLPRVVHAEEEPARRHPMLGEAAVGTAPDAGECDAAAEANEAAPEDVRRAAAAQRIPLARVFSSAEAVDTPMQRAWIEQAVPHGEEAAPALLDVGGAAVARAAIAAGRPWVLFRLVTARLDALSPDPRGGDSWRTADARRETLDRAAAKFLGVLRELVAQRDSAVV